jgi:hypothetical protein
VTFVPNSEATSPVSKGPIFTVLEDSLQYIVNEPGEEELYAFRSDSLARRNLVTAPGYAVELARLRNAQRRLAASGRY